MKNINFAKFKFHEETKINEFKPFINYVIIEKYQLIVYYF